MGMLLRQYHEPPIEDDETQVEARDGKPDEAPADGDGEKETTSKTTTSSKTGTTRKGR